MLNKRSPLSSLCEDFGKLCITSIFAYSLFVVIAAMCDKDNDGDYQERLRKAYAGLSEEEY